MRRLTKKFFSFAVNKIFPAFILASSLAASLAQAAPQGGVIVGGQGSINTSPNVTNINQQTNSMVIDWSSFNVGSQETVNFNQPSSNAAALNRIYDQNPSQIFGAINANGRVFLSNPNGLIFGQTATVNVGALVATGLTISKENFMNGNYHFNSDGYTPGAIINRGLLTAASGGSVSLVGGQVVNEGYIVADYGRIDLATGKQAILNFDGDGLINIQVSEDILTNLNGAESSVSNTGNLQANGGRILLDAHVAKDVFTNAINNEGMIKAHRISNSGGEVYLSSNDSTLHTGEIDVYGEGDTGGSVFILGDKVTLAGNATVNASGQTAGGTILIGGDYQGQGDIQTAQFTTVEENVVVNANAENSGDGGKIIVWSDDTTVFHGQINARADGVSGDGGFAEVSGKQHLLITGHADLRSNSGQIGTLLLDPGKVDIIRSNDASPPTSLDSITDSYVNAQLVTSNLVVTTADAPDTANEDLTVQLAARIEWSSSSDLTLVGRNSVTINGTITSTGGGGLALTGGSVDINNTISLNGGDFASTGTTFDNNGSTVSSTTGDVNLMHTGKVTLGTVTATDGNVTIETTGDITQRGIITADLLTTTSTGNTTLTLANTIAAYNGTTTSGNIEITSAGALDITSINSAGNATITTGSITGGNLTQSGGIISATTLTTTSTNGSTTLEASNAVSTYNGTTTGTNKTLSFTNNNGVLNISGITSSGDVVITSDQMAINAAINATGKHVTLQTLNGGTAIDLGSGTDGVPGTLELSNTEMNNITATGLTVGNSLSGAISITDSLTLTNITDLHLITSSTVADTGTGVITAATKNLAIEAGGSVNITNVNTSINNLAISATGQSVSFTNSTSLEIAGVDGITGVTGSDVTLTASSGDVFTTSATITADNLTLEATTGGIGLGGAIETAATTLSLTSGGDNNAGDIRVNNSGALNTSNVTVTTAGTTQTIDLGANNWTIDKSFGDATDNLTMRAMAGGINDDGNINTLTANSIVLDATGGIGTDNTVYTSTGVLTLKTGGANDLGDITVNNTGDLNTSSVLVTTGANSTQTIDLGANNWTIDNSFGNDVDNLTLTATVGGINDNGNNTLTANDLVLNAVSGIGNNVTAISTQANTIVFSNTTSGDVYINNSSVSGLSVSGRTGDNTPTVGGLINIMEALGDLTVAAGGLTTNGGGDVNLLTSTSDKNIVVNGNVSTAAGSSVTLLTNATSGSIIAGTGTITAGTVNLNSATGIGSAGNAINTAASNIVFNATSSGGAFISNTMASGVAVSASADIGGVVEITETAGSLTIASGTITTTGAGDNVTYTTNSGSVVLTGTTTAGITSGMVTINSAGNIAGAGTLTANTVNLTAVTGIGSLGSGNTILTVADNVMFDNTTSGGSYISNTKAGGVNVSSSATNVGQVTFTETTGATTVAATGITTSGGSISINSNDAVKLNAAITASGNTASINSNSSGISGAGIITADTVNIAASGATNISTQANTITFNSGDVVIISNTQGTGVTVSGVSSSGSVNITETSGNLGIGAGNVIAGTTVDYTTDAGNIILTGTTTTGTGSTATITSAGNISGTGTVSTGLNGTVDLFADTGIGAALTPVSTSTTNLSFLNATSGGVYISNDLASGLVVSGTNQGEIQLTETAGNLSITKTITDDGINANNNNISLFADSMTFTGSVNAGVGQITLSTLTASRGIELGGDASNDLTLGISDASLKQLSTSVGVIIGDTNHTGGITVVGNAEPTSGGTFDLLSQGNVVVNAVLETLGDTTLQSTMGSIIFGGSAAGVISTAGSIELDSNSTITGSGALILDAANDLIYNKQMIIDGTTDITAGTLTILSDIMTTTGDLSLTSAGIITFKPDITITAAGTLNLNAVSEGTGDLNLNGGTGINLAQDITVNGLTTINASTNSTGTGLTILGNLVTTGDNNISITTNDLDLDGSIDSAGGSITISDAGNSIALGLNQSGRLFIDVTEFEKISGAGLTLSTANDLIIEGSFTGTSTTPLTLSAATITMPRATTLSLQSSLDIVDSAVTAASSLDIDVAGAFSMNNTIETNGVFTLIANQGVTMGEPSSITSNNNVIDITTNGGDILLGLADAGNGNVNLTASAGSVLNNNGVFPDITRSKTNIKGTNTSIFANQRIGASSTDAITIDVSSSGLITLDFNADKAFINNLQNTRILNNGSGDVVVGLIFSGQIIGVGHNVGINSQQTEEIPKDQETEESLISILGTDYRLSAVEEEEEDSSTLNTVVPVMIRTKEGWEFKAPLRTPIKQKSKERKVNWL